MLKCCGYQDKHLRSVFRIQSNIYGRAFSQNWFTAISLELFSQTTKCSKGNDIRLNFTTQLLQLYLCTWLKIIIILFRMVFFETLVANEKKLRLTPLKMTHFCEIKIKKSNREDWILIKIGLVKDTYLKPSRASAMKLLAKIVNR